MYLPHLRAASIKTLHAQSAQALAQVLTLLSPVDQGKGVFVRLYLLMQGVGGPKDLLQLDECWINGFTNLTERRRYSIFSNEKVFRFAEHFRLNPRIRSSYQAGHDRDKGHYAGAVLIRCVVPEFGESPVHLVFSVSGLSELEDEALAVQIAMHMPWKANANDVREVVVASNNGLIPRLFAAAA